MPSITTYAKYLVEFVPVYWHDLQLLKTAKADGSLSARWNYLHQSSLAGILQVREELEKLLLVLRESRPKVVLEIGTAKGGTLLFWTAVASDDGLIVTLDLPQGPFGGGYRRSQGWLFRGFRRKNQQLYFMRGDSHDSRMLRRIIHILRGQPVDFLFIDGDHSREGVECDYQMYGPLVRRGGIIAFHDIVKGLPQYVGGVPDFWAYLKSQMRCNEIVKDPEQGGAGIGWLVKEE